MEFHRWLAPPLLLALTTGLAYVVLSLPEQAPGLQGAVLEQLEDSGVSHPVTAVLLNFRGYDTLLEMVVLLVALLGVLSLGSLPPPPPEATPGPVLETLVRLLLPILGLVAAYLLWRGASAPGGAFQAGSVLAAAGVLGLLAGLRIPAHCFPGLFRFAAALGILVFLAVAMLTLLSGGVLLDYPPERAGLLILLIETAATLAIAVTLTTLFLGSTTAR